MSYLRNTWYMAGWSHEVVADKPLARTLLGENLVFFRDSANKISILSNRCPHRFAPLALGTVVADALQCPYHGLRFNGQGVCVHNPHGNGVIPQAAKVKSYPAVDCHSAIWVWMGDPDRANPELLPDFSMLDSNTNHIGTGYLSVKANYQLETDNILDLSHIEYLHGESLGNDVVRDAKTDVTQQGNTVWSKRQTSAEVLPPALEAHYGSPPGILWDRWFDVRWDPPASMLLLVGSVPTGTPRTAESRQIPFVHLFTPEGEYTTHYWFATSYPMSYGDKYAERAKADIAFLGKAFEHEDLPMLQAQQEAMGTTAFWDLKPLLLSGDVGAVKARRVLDKLIRDEQTPPVTTVV